MKDATKDAIAEAVRRHGGNVREACRTLGMSERTLHRLLTRLGLRDMQRRARKPTTRAAA